MKRWLQIASVLILLPFIGKILFLETGLLAQSMYKLSLVCHCNHGSKNEIHKEEDSPTPTRITCHLTKNSGQHQCSCAKKKSVTKVLQSQLMNPSFTTETKFNQTMNLVATSFPILSNSNLPIGFTHLPYKPPRSNFT
ncbi:hypothetical protein EHQ68_13060 [Leptospira congkakensis]|uniref:Uncharacterized protein n=1 Tax=Leptospira congkakensis TaxID=2484932 RepID=A0A4Z1A8P1_9LEPT|nr:hypothetical protein [Leptospira congkakensis]TGL86255.1 hypothetical protein EHQ68_13060 [Leptospira congkakensis]TGL94200.1 hypothetical protein EHQ69_06970 [Leptospira congkakensis]TGL94391.1 hypothetical protein EHQ70_13820 [Leptospira congkakensis]